MGGLIFDLYLSLEYRDEEHSLSGVLNDCSAELSAIVASVFSSASDYFRQEPVSNFTFIATKDSVEATTLLIEGGILLLLASTS